MMRWLLHKTPTCFIKKVVWPSIPIPHGCCIRLKPAKHHSDNQERTDYGSQQWFIIRLSFSNEWFGIVLRTTRTRTRTMTVDAYVQRTVWLQFYSMRRRMVIKVMQRRHCWTTVLHVWPIFYKAIDPIIQQTYQSYHSDCDRYKRFRSIWYICPATFEITCEGSGVLGVLHNAVSDVIYFALQKQSDAAVQRKLQRWIWSWHHVDIARNNPQNDSERWPKQLWFCFYGWRKWGNDRNPIQHYLKSEANAETHLGTVPLFYVPCRRHCCCRCRREYDDDVSRKKVLIQYLLRAIGSSNNSCATTIGCTLITTLIITIYVLRLTLVRIIAIFLKSAVHSSHQSPCGACTHVFVKKDPTLKSSLLVIRWQMLCCALLCFVLLFRDTRSMVVSHDGYIYESSS